MFTLTNKLKRYFYVLMPTSNGVVAYILLTLGIVVTSKYDVITKTLNQLNNALNNSIGEKDAALLTSVVVWGVIGFIIYLFMYELINFVDEVKFTVDNRSHHKWPKGANKNGPLEHLAVRSLFKLLIFVGIIIYIIRILGKAAWDLAHQIVSQNSLNSDNLLKDISMAVLMCFAWHGLMVLLRLEFQRHRFKKLL